MLYNNQGILVSYSEIICEQILSYLDRNFTKGEKGFLRAKQRKRINWLGGGSCLINYIYYVFLYYICILINLNLCVK